MRAVFYPIPGPKWSGKSDALKRLEVGNLNLNLVNLGGVTASTTLI